MRKILLLPAVITTFCLEAQNHEIQKVIEPFFEAFHAKDSVQLKVLCNDGMIPQSIAENAKGVMLSNEDPKVFFKSIASIPKEVVF